jgi:hypothetical protein
MFTYVFSGLWPLVWHFGLGFGVMGLALAWWWFVPIGKKSALWVAFTAGVITVSYTAGVKNGEYRVQAEWDAAVSREVESGAAARAAAERNVSPTPGVRGKKLDRRDRG